MAKDVLALDGIVKRYGNVTALGPVSFTVEEGEFLTLLGPSGCGKTTTLHVIAGLLEPDGGRLLMRGDDITALPTDRRGMGVVFQNYALFPHKTVEENIGFGLRMRRVAKPQIQERVREMLDIVGPAGRRGALSAPVERRAAPARRPRPRDGDPPARPPAGRTALEPGRAAAQADAERAPRHPAAHRHHRPIYVTHDQDEAFEMSDRVILLNHGSIEQIGTPGVPVRPPRDPVCGRVHRRREPDRRRGRRKPTDGIARISAAGAGTIPADARDSGPCGRLGRASGRAPGANPADQ